MEIKKIINMIIDGINHTSNDEYAFKKELISEVETKKMIDFPNKFKTFSVVDKNNYFYGKRFIRFMIDENANILGIDNKKDLYFGKISYNYILSIYRTNRLFGVENELVYTQCKLNNEIGNLCLNNFYIEPFWKTVNNCDNYQLQDFGCDSLVYYEIKSERIKQIRDEIKECTADSSFDVDFSHSCKKRF